MDWIHEVSEIELADGIANCGSYESYISILTVFYKSAKGNMEDIRRCLEQKDIPNYTIKVHGLKSSARIIGAGELSAAAKELEEAGRAGDIAFIEANNDRLLSMYADLESKLTQLDGQDEQKPELKGAELEEAFQTMAEIAGTMDYGLMEDLLDNLNGYRINEKDSDLIKSIGFSLLKLDWDEIRAQLERR